MIQGQEVGRAGDLPCVVLFDIDGTLVAGPGRGPSAGLLSMNRAAELLTGVDDTGDPREFAGRTDPQIARMLLQIAGEPDPPRARVELLVARYVEELAKNVRRAPYRALGSPREAIPALEARGAIVGLGTGNVRPGARIKLTSAGIDDLFDLKRGGYGDDGATRADVLQRAIHSCDPTGERPVIVVGDTPRDVSAALDVGALCIATPFHANTPQVLRDAGAHAVIDAIGPQLVAAIEQLLATS
jgi:phosphoglycolate phosphatase-like HAD superfamily hydrolase